MGLPRRQAFRLDSVEGRGAVISNRPEQSLFTGIESWMVLLFVHVDDTTTSRIRTDGSC